MLFQRIYPASRSAMPAGGSTLVSLALHGAILGGVALYMGGVTQVHQTVTEGMFFLAPPPTPPAGPHVVAERISFAELPAPEGLGDAFGSDVGSLARPVEGAAGQLAGRAAEDIAGMTASRELPNIFAEWADSVYLSSQVDNPVAFDARSAAPVYPDSLRLAGVEGAVTAQFVVDTTGRVELGTFVLLESSHGRFTQSVRDALPRMLFRPAELNGRKIKQLVQLPFVFRMEHERQGLQPAADSARLVGGRGAPDSGAVP